jgi:hypothetical protein
MRLMKPPLPNPRGGKAIPPLTFRLDQSIGRVTPPAAPFYLTRTDVDEESRAMKHAALWQCAQAEPTNTYRSALQR